MTQGTDTKVEGVKRAEEQAKPIQQEEKPAEPKTYTQEELQRAVGKGLESIQRQLDLRDAEVRKAESQLKSKEADLKAFQEDLAELQKLKLDDPELMETYTSRKAIRDAQREVDRARAELEDQRYEAEMAMWRQRMDAKAIELVKETGIDINEFVGCQTEEEIEAKALRWEKTHKSSAKEEEKPPKFDTGISSGATITAHPSIEQLEKMSPKEYAEWYKARQKR